MYKRQVQGHGTAPEMQELRWNTAPEEPPAPQAIGYLFGGWYQDEGCTVPYDFTAPLQESDVAYALWTVCDHSGSSRQSSCTEEAVCTECGALMPKTPHAYRRTEYTPGTETQEGRIVYTCAACGASYQTVLPMGTCPSAPFTDVDRNAWYHEAVDFVVERALMDGVRDDQFDPEGTLTRAMMATILYRLSRETWIVGSSSFEDVPMDSWYGAAVAWAEANGIVDGVSEGKFDPQGAVTREQIVTMLYRYAQREKYDISGAGAVDVFVDAEDISPWALQAVQWAVGNGLMEGSSGMQLLPGDRASRVQAAALLQRFMEKWILA